MAIHYQIKIEKDGRNVQANYDLGVIVGGEELIADFQLYVEGENLIKNFIAGQTRFNGSGFHVLAKPDEDAPVSYSISDNQGWSTAGDDTLRGSRRYDEASFHD